MKTNLKHGMLQTVYTGEETIRTRTYKVLENGEEIEKTEQYATYAPVMCADKKCGRMVAHNAPCFIDSATGEVWCDDCGKCERYARKRAAMREAKQAEPAKQST
jgi:hypothetical protein